MSTHRHEAKLNVAVLHQKVVNVIVICAHKLINRFYGAKVEIVRRLSKRKCLKN